MQDNKILWVTITTVLVVVFAYSLFLNSPTYTVTFDSSGGTQIEEQTIRRNGYLEVEVPARTGYTFVGWKLNDELFDLETEGVVNDMILTAYWEAITFTITFDSNRGTEVEPIEVVYGNAAERPDNPTRNNRRFHYWAIDEERFDWETPIYENIELVAVWRR